MRRARVEMDSAAEIAVPVKVMPDRNDKRRLGLLRDVTPPRDFVIIRANEGELRGGGIVSHFLTSPMRVSRCAG